MHEAAGDARRAQHRLDAPKRIIESGRSQSSNAPRSRAPFHARCGRETRQTVRQTHARGRGQCKMGRPTASGYGERELLAAGETMLVFATPALNITVTIALSGFWHESALPPLVARTFAPGSTYWDTNRADEHFPEPGPRRCNSSHTRGGFRQLCDSLDRR